MLVTKIQIKNFRLLADVRLCLEKATTVIVGRNNSGKTSLTELFRRLLSDGSPTFRLEDFSLCSHEAFWTAFTLKHAGNTEDEIRASLPVIEVSMTLNYEPSSQSLGSLGAFIVDLNPDCTTAQLLIRFQLEDGKIEQFFDGIAFDHELPHGPQKLPFCRELKDRVPQLYKATLHAVDPNDESNTKPMLWSQLHGLLLSGFINAQRGLDDATHKDKDVLGKILEALFNTASSALSDPDDRGATDALNTAVQDMQDRLDGDFNTHLKTLIPAFSLFGYPGLSDPSLRTETTLDVQSILSNHTKVRYAGINGVNLPEAYNGLGARNLIFMLLQLLEFFKSFKAKESAPGIHLVFIEEPEAHLHPQMAEVFIRQLDELSAIFSREFNDGVAWPVQFIVTTHSTHMANEVRFEAIRYFLATESGDAGQLRSTRIKDLRTGLGGTPEEDRDFLHKYMTLTRCDLLFADKAVLIEGPSERLLLPAMIEKIDNEQIAGPKLASQYVSVIEVGGAYAHLFFALLEFLEVPTLVVTDLDSVKRVEKVGKTGKTKKTWIGCMVSEATRTSNACVKYWFNDKNITPTVLIANTAKDRTKGLCRIAYQIAETDGGACARSFEDAFILANPKIFNLNGDSEAGKATKAWKKAVKIENEKTDFALKYAITQSTWAVPRYIAEGLRWLANTPEKQDAVMASHNLTPSPSSAHPIDRNANNAE